MSIEFEEGTNYVATGGQTGFHIRFESDVYGLLSLMLLL